MAFSWLIFQLSIDEKPIKAPILTKVIEENEKVDLLKIDVDEFDELAAHFQAMGL